MSADLVHIQEGDLLARRRSLVHHAADIRTLAIGSSHGGYGFDPAVVGNAFNFCTASQDLYYSLKVYEFCATALPGMQDVALFYSLFSPGFDLIQSAEKMRCIGWRRVMGIDYPVPDAGLDQAALTRPVMHPAAPDVPPDFGFSRTASRFFFGAGYKAERRAGDHLKFSQAVMTDCPMHAYAAKLADLAAANGHRLLIIVPPVRADFREALPKANYFSQIEALARSKGVSVHNMFDDPDFAFDDFGDFDHLRPDGPGVDMLSSKVAEALGRCDAA